MAPDPTPDPIPVRVGAKELEVEPPPPGPPSLRLREDTWILLRELTDRLNRSDAAVGMDEVAYVEGLIRREAVRAKITAR